MKRNAADNIHHKQINTDASFLARTLYCIVYFFFFQLLTGPGPLCANVSLTLKVLSNDVLYVIFGRSLTSKTEKPHQSKPKKAHLVTLPWAPWNSKVLKSTHLLSADPVMWPFQLGPSPSLMLSAVLWLTFIPLLSKSYLHLLKFSPT